MLTGSSWSYCFPYWADPRRGVVHDLRAYGRTTLSKLSALHLFYEVLVMFRKYTSARNACAEM
ncbi:protein of unknown function (plasmid) [Shinella sp. WSC3-e]|nr:protein of unknown function [Shinella sp. WSC3-e]